MKKKMIKAGIIGASGYTGSELIRLLLLHPDVDISFVNSSTYTKKKVSDVFNDLIGETELVFSNKINIMFCITRKIFPFFYTTSVF